MTMELTIPHTIPILALPPQTVLYPGLVLRLQIQSKESIALMQHISKRFMNRQLIACMPVKLSQEDMKKLAVSSASEIKGDLGSNVKESEKSLIPYANSTRKQDLLCDFGCASRVIRLERSSGTGYHAVVEGLARIKVEKYVSDSPFLEADFQVFPEIGLGKDSESVNLLVSLKNVATEMVAMLNDLKMPALILKRLQAFISDVDITQAGALADLMASSIDINYAEKLQILTSVETKERCEKMIEHLTRQIEVLKVSQKVSKNVDSKLSKKQREFYLRQQLNAIKEELGEIDGDGKDQDDIAELQKRLNEGYLSPEASTVSKRELQRLKRMNPMMGEYQICRTYLEWLADLPWARQSEDGFDDDCIKRARYQLDADHYGLEKIKKRLLEYLAVVRLRKSMEGAEVISKSLSSSIAEAAEGVVAGVTSPPVFRDKGPILLFVGPPGTGKTSIAKSLAIALGRKYYRISLGGVRDEAEIRGHRRTYIGAMPGLLVQALKKVKVNNPVILLDEIDKISGSNFHGDPSAAMLEVLDPEQNVAFNDHYINVPVDLSQVLFIATANTLDTISPPLLDRMEVINLPGYTFQEKLHIAQRYLLPKQIKNHGLNLEQIKMDSKVLLKIIIGYTREAGVRNLEREIATICRVKAVEYAETKENTKVNYDPLIRLEDLERILGVEKYDDEVAQRHSKPGVVTGLAYMGSGNGGIMFIEASQMPGCGNLHLTGKLGDVIKESAHIALSWVKTHAYDLGLTKSSTESLMENRDVHLHLPAGAVPKDGPSAGMALVICLVSLFSSKNIPATLAMTGELSLRGLILPVGGIKEKVLAAHRAGIKRVMLSKRNRKDVYSGDLPIEVVKPTKIISKHNSSIKEENSINNDTPLEFVFVDNVYEALQVAFEDVGGIGKYGCNGNKWSSTVIESRL